MQLRPLYNAVSFLWYYMYIISVNVEAASNLATLCSVTCLLHAL